MRIGAHSAIITITILLATIPSLAADQQVTVRQGQLQTTLATHLDRARPARVLLKDGTTLEGIAAATPTSGLELRPPKAAPRQNQLISYADISEIRLDQGPKRAWEIGGAFIGGIAASILAMAITYERSGTAQNVAVITSITAGPSFGAKLGSRHRKWLVITQRPD